MASADLEQRNEYIGSPPRPWLRVLLLEPGEEKHECRLLADTGNPFAIIVDSETMNTCKLFDGPDASTNFGRILGGWLHVTIPELRFDRVILGYASDAVAKSASASSANLTGLIGLPLLRMFEYGGNENSFWLRTDPANEVVR